MTDPEDEKDLAGAVEKVLAYAADAAMQRVALSAALKLFHSKGYRAGYGDAMKDAAEGKDRRVKAHLN